MASEARAAGGLSRGPGRSRHSGAAGSAAALGLGRPRAEVGQDRGRGSGLGLGADHGLDGRHGSPPASSKVFGLIWTGTSSSILVVIGGRGHAHEACGIGQVGLRQCGGELELGLACGVFSLLVRSRSDVLLLDSTLAGPALAQAASSASAFAAGSSSPSDSSSSPPAGLACCCVEEVGVEHLGLEALLGLGLHALCRRTLGLAGVSSRRGLRRGLVVERGRSTPPWRRRRSNWRSRPAPLRRRGPRLGAVLAESHQAAVGELLDDGLFIERRPADVAAVFLGGELILASHSSRLLPQLVPHRGNADGNRRLVYQAGTVYSGPHSATSKRAAAAC